MPNQTTSTLCSTEKKAVLLQTACTVVHNPANPKVVLEIRLLFDSGSQRSYISDCARKLLQLVAVEDRGGPFVCHVWSSTGADKGIVKVGICLKGYPTMSLLLYTVPNISEPLSCQPISTCVEANNHLLSLDL